MYRTSVLILHQHITLHNHLFSIFEISPKAKQAIIHSLKKILKLGKKFYTQAYECMVNNFFLINKALYKMSYITGIVTMMH